MSEIKIHEERFLSLVEKEQEHAELIKGVLTLIIYFWKRENPFKTEEDREKLIPHINKVFKDLGLSMSFTFNNNYNNAIHFRTNWVNKDYYVSVTEIDLSTGLSIEKTEYKKLYWINVKDDLPAPLQTVWISNGKGWTTLGCRTNADSDGNWCWSETNGTIYEHDRQIVSECEEDDLDVLFWQPLPKTLKIEDNITNKQ